MRRPRLRIAILLLPTLVLIISGLAAPSFGSLQQVGVSVGDWMKYKVTLEGNMSAAWIGMCDVEWVRIEVLNITGMTVELLESSYYKDDDVYNRTMAVNTTKPWDPHAYVIPANLTLEDDGIFDKNWRLQINDTMKISAITVKNFTGATREVCLFELKYVVPYFGDPLNITERFWWDRKTGFLLEYTSNTFIEWAPRQSGSSITIAVAETSLWETPPQPSDPMAFIRWAIITTVLAVGGVAATLSIKRKKPKVNKKKEIEGTWKYDIWKTNTTT